MTVRVRYAPSPTGEPHVGNIRTAMFNWLFARHHGGQFIVRIEDTDQARLVPGALESILEALRWLGLDWDEGPGAGGPHAPYVQSERLEMYRDAAARLIAAGHAYECTCTPERLDEMRKAQQARKEPPRYDRRCRTRQSEVAAETAAGASAVVRFAVPLDGERTVHDLIRGDVTFDNAVLDDFVLLKSDGWPTYHLAHVVDDHAMRITHVLRAEEWLPSTTRHILLYEALGYEPPLFAHMPIILGPDRGKLSKRHGATSLLSYRDEGYLPEAMVNFLALLGWSLDDHTEVMPRETIVANFSIERIGKTGAIFDRDKLTWMNGVYIREMAAGELAQRVIPFLERPAGEGGLPESVARPIDRAYLAQVVPLVHERLKLLAEATELTDFFFADPLPAYDPALLLGKRFRDDAAAAALALAATADLLAALPDWTAEALESAIRATADALGIEKHGDLFTPVRVAVSGRAAAPPLFEMMAVLGRERCLARLAAAQAQLAAR